METAKVQGLSPPGLAHAALPPYKSHVYQNKQYIRPQSNVKTNIVKVGTDVKSGLRIVTINVTSWSPKIITMITKMANEYDIILIQEHHKFRKQDMKTGPYIIAGFAPAQRTVRTKNGKGWHLSGGVAILVRDNLYFERDKHIPQQGPNWAAIKIRLKRQPGQPKNQGNSINIITSYTKHGWGVETLQTIEEVQNYLGMFNVPWVWGGDFSRPPEVMLEQGLHMQVKAYTPKGEGSTCTVGGLIDYFLVPANEPNMARECSMIRRSTIKPHYPVQILVDRRPHLTKVLAPIATKKWPEAEGVFPKITWEQSSAKLKEIGWKLP